MYLNNFMQITLLIQLVFKILAKASYRTNLLLCWIPIVVFDNSEARATEATRSRLESANHTLLHTKWLPCTSIHYRNIVWVLKTHLRTSNSPITRSIKDIFDLKTNQNTDLGELIDRRTAQPDGDDHWPVTVTSKNVFPRCRMTLSQPRHLKLGCAANKTLQLVHLWRKMAVWMEERSIVTRLQERRSARQRELQANYSPRCRGQSPGTVE